MRPGGSNAKGAAFERATAEAFSLWISDGNRKDLFWRSPGSGARAARAAENDTIFHKHAGDLIATSREGDVLTDSFVIECKHVRDLGLGQFVLARPSLAGTYWSLVEECARKQQRAPMLVARQNHAVPIVLLPWRIAEHWPCCKSSLRARAFAADVAILDLKELVASPFEAPPALPELADNV